MPSSITDRPSSADHSEYFQRYISLVPAGDLVGILRKQLDEVRATLAPLTDAQGGFSYAPGKWTVREVLGHLIDTERVFGFRAMHMSRNDKAPLPSMEQDEWNPHGEFDKRTMSDLLDEFSAVRESTIRLVQGMPAAGLSRRGIASGNPLSALAALTIIPGHAEYHLRHFREVYFPKM